MLHKIYDDSENEMKLIHAEGPWKASWITSVQGRNGKAIISTGAKGLWFSLIRKITIWCGAGHGLLDLSLSWSNSSKTVWEICRKAAVIIPTKPNKMSREDLGDAFFLTLQSCCTCWTSGVCTDVVFYHIEFNRMKWEKKTPQTSVLHYFYVSSEKSWTLSLSCLLAASVHITFC